MEAPFDVSGYSFKCNYGDLYHNVIDTSRLSMGFSKLSDKKYHDFPGFTHIALENGHHHSGFTWSRPLHLGRLFKNTTGIAAHGRGPHGGPADFLRKFSKIWYISDGFGMFVDMLACCFRFMSLFSKICRWICRSVLCSILIYVCVCISISISIYIYIHLSKEV